MFASSTGPRSAARRRGIVLVLVLGMLGLMALIGVTFATFAGQSLKNGRNYSLGVARPQAEALMDYALAQLINDTSNPQSALRGHSLLRDMYGNDSLFRGGNPPANPVAETRGLITNVNATPLRFTRRLGLHSTANSTPFYNQAQYVTNIPIGGQYAGYDFKRWIVRFPGFTTSITTGIFPSAYVAQTFEILEDDATGNLAAGFHVFTLSANLVNPTTNDPTYVKDNDNSGGGAGTVPNVSSSDWTSFIYNDPNLGAVANPAAVAPDPKYSKNYTHLLGEANTSGANAGLATTSSNPFFLDGRYMRAFNGPGLTRPSYPVDVAGTRVFTPSYPFNAAAYGNMRVIGSDPAVRNGVDVSLAGLGNPDATGMDEDYDACDLENWFLGIQSADGQVMIPSFHRPGILTANDWNLPQYDPSGVVINAPNRSKILRPRQVDHSPQFPADPSTPNSDPLSPDFGKLTYDIDNDGDGVTDSVWLDLGYPVQRDSNGKLSKPLFAFMILGLNGRLPLNTVGNLQARAIGDKTYNPAPDSVQYPNSSGIVPYPGPYDEKNNHRPFYTSQVFFDTPLYDHTSHLGYSVNEINPKFALQNAPSNVYPTTGPDAIGQSYGQSDNSGVSVALTQLRNILAGTVPTDQSNPYTGAAAVNNNDMNVVAVNNQPYILPNNVKDRFDVFTGSNSVTRSTPPVPGRWGEPDGIPRELNYGLTADFDPDYPIFHYNNRVGPGRSFFGSTAGTNDAMDDDFDAFDPYLANPSFTATRDFTMIPAVPAVASGIYEVPLDSAIPGVATFNRANPEDVDAFDAAGQTAVAVERIRRYVTPQDPVGVGRMVARNARPLSPHDYGLGADTRGRVGFFRYFRPAGMPQEVRYPYPDQATAGTNFSYPYLTNSGTGQRYLMPVLVPAGRPTGASTPDVANNVLHGYQSMATPQATGTYPATNAPDVAVMGAMPYDWDATTGAAPTGYGSVTPPNPIALLSPTIDPTSSANFATHNQFGPNVGGHPTYQLPYVPVVVNGYLGGSLNKDEADEMNLYTVNSHDMPYGATDLEWLYRKHDVDGATLNSRLEKLAPISFLNPADGLTRRRLFSTDSWELNNYVFANDNPVPYAGVLGGDGIPLGTRISSPDHDFSHNSRFMPQASASLELMNQVVETRLDRLRFYQFANPITSQFLPNPTLPTNTPLFPGNRLPSSYDATGLSGGSYVPNSSQSPIDMPRALNPATPTNLFSNRIVTARVNDLTNVIQPSNNPSAAQVQTPSLAHRDRKINLNFPLPISNDPAEPIRQKWCRDTYRMLKAILPPASVDTPEELAALSQFVVNIIDFRDPDCTMTRFVNTDLEVTDVLTKSLNNQVADPLDKIWAVSPSGVRFNSTTLPAGSFPHDPSLYSPDAVSPFLVQHGMEYNPLALNEVMAYQASASLTPDSAPASYQAFFIELVNTLTQSQNDQNSQANSSAVSLAGWDILVTPDNYGWGRPDPISGDLNPVAAPLFNPDPTGDVDLPPTDANRKIATGTTDPNLSRIVEIPQYSFPLATPKVQAMNGNTAPKFVIGDYRDGATSIADANLINIEGNNPVVAPAARKVQLPPTFKLPTPPANSAAYYWVYLRRPANPFDTAVPNQVRPNKEMVVVDAMRFPAIDTGIATVTTNPTGPPTVIRARNVVYSAQRFQPYRGGHLIRINTPVDPDNPTARPTTGRASGTTTICPPSPPHAYGYSEQTVAPPAAGDGHGLYTYTQPSPGTRQTTSDFHHTLDNPNTTPDTNWSHFAFHDRDFTNVAELLLVPGSPPGLFTKQFVEEPYPGNVYGDTVIPHVQVAQGTDNSDFTGALTTLPNASTNPSRFGRQNFNVAAANLPAVPTFPYLTDNFYYTAASVAPPVTGTLPAGYTRMTTEIGGWTGAGWHKMMELFEVPSSANGAIGLAANGDNYDWSRADLKPGLLNLNLIIDEEVFAGLIDDPRLNENLASATSSIPHVVSQIDANGRPAYDPVNNPAQVYGQQPIFNQRSVNIGASRPSNFVGRGYVYRDPDVNNYTANTPPYPPYRQQVHGLKAAFSDFLKLRHGGSGYLFAHGGGDVGMGDFEAGPLALPIPAKPIAADRPYRSLSYPDINYTIMRPASLPPAPIATNVYVSPGTVPPLPIPATGPPVITTGLGNLFTYDAEGGAPFVRLSQLLAPMNDTTGRYQYVQDPGIKNPYLGVQYVNTASPDEDQPVVTDPPLSKRRLAPPYEATEGPGLTPPRPIAAPFPPPIPPTPTRRLLEVPDKTDITLANSNASVVGGFDPTATLNVNQYPVNQPTIPRMLSTNFTTPPTPPSLVPLGRPVFGADNFTPAPAYIPNYLGQTSATDLRQHPVYRTEWLQKISNLTTVRTHQFATWITVGFFEVVKPGTPELGIPDVLGGEVGNGAGEKIRYRSFFVLDRTRATGFNPYYPGNFRDCVTYRRRIE